MRRRRPAGGFSLLELTVYIAIASALLATIGTVELIARRATFYQSAVLDVLDDAERVRSSLVDDLEGFGVASIEVDDGRLVAIPTAGPGGERPARIEYARADDARVVRTVVAGPDAEPEAWPIARHVAAFDLSLETDSSGRPVLVAYTLAFDRLLPAGHRYRKTLAGAIVVGPPTGDR